MRAILQGPIRLSLTKQRALLRSLQITSFDLLIGVDGGLEVWKDAGVRPHFAVGDWDSLVNKRLLSQVSHVSLSKEKERSDLFYAGIAAIFAGADELHCLGVTGGRFDHHFGSLCDLSQFSSGRFGVLKKVVARGEGGSIFFLSPTIPRWKQDLPIGSIVSVFAMDGNAEGVSLSGFKYSLKNKNFYSSSMGLSNEVTKNPCIVELKKGNLLVMVPEGGSYAQ